MFPVGAAGQGGGSDQGLQPRDGSKRGADGENQKDCDELSQGGDYQAGGGRGKAQRGVGQKDERPHWEAVERPRGDVLLQKLSIII